MSSNDEQIDRFVEKLTAGFVARQRSVEMTHVEEGQMVSPGPFTQSYIESATTSKGKGR